MYEVFEHTADLGLRIEAPQRNELYAEAGLGLFSLITRLDQVRPLQETAFEVVGQEPAYLLFDLLNELLFRFETQALLVSQIEVTEHDDGLSVLCRGETCDRERHDLHHEVKAITYHGLQIGPAPQGGWQAEVIVDI
ncbi:hypothetical protein Pla8534_63510 [Lignipirellula cremea]|uniref:Archease domain-containing protein n=2 Tax=Lignipirellula cremea TaxID=2528010 RepID=A0A518E338_9BACT|nr:hypothetical protein Pla8534_63510 [Lignipirellula cremea]